MTDNPLTQEVRIEAPPDVVFPFFTDPEKMARWMGVTHKLDPVPGGVLMVEVNNAAVAIGEYVEVDPPRRVVFTWGWRENAEVPPGSSTVEIDITADGDASLLRLTHRGLPAGQDEQHAHGWNHFLSRLVISAAGGDPGPDPMAQMPS
jgi:uncharacterized protein YndB with AHSA1/START domain